MLSSRLSEEHSSTSSTSKTGIDFMLGMFSRHFCCERMIEA